MNMLSIVYGSSGNAKAKRARHGFEKDWNRYGEPLKKLLCGHFDNKMWLKYRQQKFSEIN